jgi:hypothetical protein
VALVIIVVNIHDTAVRRAVPELADFRVIVVIPRVVHPAWLPMAHHAQVIQSVIQDVVLAVPVALRDYAV